MREKIIEILKSYENSLSDGYGYYTGADQVDFTLGRIADEIIENINKGGKA